MFLAVFLLCEMAISPSTPLWWCKVNQFPKGFPNPLLYYTGYNKPLTYNLSASLSDSFGLERFSGGIAIHLLHCFLSWRQEFQTRMECLWQQKFHNFSFRYNCPKYSMTYPKSYDGNRTYFFPCVSYRWSVLILFPLITLTDNSLFGRAALWVVQGLRAPHSIYTMCTQPWQFKATLIPSE